MLGAQVGDALDVAVGRRIHAAGADHRLAEEPGDAVGPDAQDLRLQRLQRVVLDVEIPPTSGPQLVTFASMPPMLVPKPCVRGSPACARSGDPLRVALGTPVAAAIFAAVSIVSPPPEPRNTRASSIGATAARRCRTRSPGSCRSRRTSSTRRSCPSARRPPRRCPRGRGRGWRTRGCGAVEVAVALGVVHRDALAALDDQLALTDRAHVGEGMPEACRRSGHGHGGGRYPPTRDVKVRYSTRRRAAQAEIVSGRRDRHAAVARAALRAVAAVLLRVRGDRVGLAVRRA